MNTHRHAVHSARSDDWKSALAAAFVLQVAVFDPAQSSDLV